MRLFQVHPTTVKFIVERVDPREPEAPLRMETFRRVGTYLEAKAKTSPDIRDHPNTGH